MNISSVGSSAQSGRDLAELSRKEQEVDLTMFCHPLSFEKFFSRCKDKLNFVLVNQFKKDKKFNDLLLEICKTETQQQFFERAEFIKKPQTPQKVKERMRLL
jgi:hypothetical protein